MDTTDHSYRQHPKIALVNTWNISAEGFPLLQDVGQNDVYWRNVSYDDTRYAEYIKTYAVQVLGLSPADFETIDDLTPSWDGRARIRAYRGGDCIGRRFPQDGHKQIFRIIESMYEQHRRRFRFDGEAPGLPICIEQFVRMREPYMVHVVRTGGKLVSTPSFDKVKDYVTNWCSGETEDELARQCTIALDYLRTNEATVEVQIGAVPHARYGREHTRMYVRDIQKGLIGDGTDGPDS